MQMGFNSDVKHRGVTVHIQTEDHGLNSAKITTQVFFSGAVLDSRSISYEELIESIDDETRLAEQVKRRMKALHKYFHNQIGRGAYDHRLPIADEVAADEQTDAPRRERKPTPPPVPAVATGDSTTVHKAWRQPNAAWLSIEKDIGHIVGPTLLDALSQAS